MSKVITSHSMSMKIRYEEGYMDSEKIENFIEYSYCHTNAKGKITVIAHNKHTLKSDKVLFSTLDIKDLKNDIKDEIMAMPWKLKADRWTDSEVHIIIPIKQMRICSTLAKNRLFRELIREHIKNENVYVKVNEMSAENWLYLIRLRSHWNKKDKNKTKRVLNRLR